MNEGSAKDLQDLHMLEHSLQSFIMQKQNFQLELSEISNAISELGKAGDEVYRVLGGIMLKSDKSSLNQELMEKKKMVELRISSIEKQEDLLEKKAKELRDKVVKSSQN